MTRPPAVEARKPAKHSREAPGRKKPTSSPLSANTIAARAIRPPLRSQSLAKSSRPSTARRLSVGPPRRPSAGGEGPYGSVSAGGAHRDLGGDRARLAAREDHGDDQHHEAGGGDREAGAVVVLQGDDRRQHQ